MTRCPQCAEPAPCLKCVEPPVVNQAEPRWRLTIFAVGIFAIAAFDIVTGNWPS